MSNNEPGSIPPADPWVRLGRLGKSHGVGGELRLWPEADDPDWYFDLDPGRIFLLKPDDSAPRPARIEFRGWLGGAIRVAIEGVNSPEEARPFAGAVLLIHESLRPILPLDEFYLDQLIGLQALAPSGQSIGRVDEIVQSGARTFLAIQGDGNRLLLTPDPGLIERIDLEAGTLQLKMDIQPE